jgi:NAD(P)-dependent dehydrogenase (short-subunit alcohol dehydrogenase family)
MLLSADCHPAIEVDSSLQRAADHFGRIDLVINAVGGGAGTALYGGGIPGERVGPGSWI